MKVRLLKNIKDNKLIEEGTIVDFEENKAKGLIAIGVAELVEEPKKDNKLEKKEFKRISKED